MEQEIDENNKTLLDLHIEKCKKCLEEGIIKNNILDCNTKTLSYGPEDANIFIITATSNTKIDSNFRISEDDKRYRLLLDALIANEIELENIYIANVLKCQNFDNEISGQDVEYIKRCINHLLSEIKTVKPKCIVLAGAIPLKIILGSKTNINNMHGKIQKIQNMYYYPIYGIDDIFNKDNLKKEFWNDIKKLKEISKENGWIK